MEKLDKQFTEKLQAWLDTAPEDRNIPAGAEMLLQMNRNRAFYNTVMRRPERYAEKLEYELRKHLRIRLDGLTLAEVTALEQKIMPEAQAIIAGGIAPMGDQAVVDTANERPAATKAKGRRADHDSLPASIQSLWEENLQNYRTINLLFEELKAMSHLMPCDRYDKLQMLAAADERYRKNLQRYDDYVIGSEPAPLSEEAARKINAARKSISKYRARIAKGGITEDVRAAAVAAIQRNVSVIEQMGAGFTTDTVKELSEYGVIFANGAAQ